MESSAWSLVVSSAIFITWLLLLLVWRLHPALSNSNGRNQRPPGPPGWPIVGNIFDLGPLPHQTMYELRPKYGPLLWLKLCSVNTLVVQSAEAAAELFKNHDLAFCGRICPDAFTAVDYNLSTIVFGSYNQYWRNMKRVLSTHLLSNKIINETVSMRRKCVDNMIRSVEEESAAAVARGESGEVDLTSLMYLLSFNVIGNLAFSRDMFDSQSPGVRDFFGVTCGMSTLGAKPNIADYVPLLKWLDPQGLKRDTARILKQGLSILSTFVAERLEEHKKIGLENVNARDFMDVLLQYRLEENTKEHSPSISEHTIKLVLLEMFMAGSESTSSTMEWVMTQLLRNPSVLTKVREELDRVVGARRKVEESDIDKLVYLQDVIKESLRLTPTGPLLVPRDTLEDTNYMGYLIAKNTQVLVNVWAIGRDPDVWSDPLCFKPERFLGSDSNINYKGQNYELIPFGSGRRMCPGISLAHRVLHLGLASLVHCFDWELGDPQTIDVNLRMGLALRKVVPLKAIPKKRIPSDHKYI